mgnify:CR=1
MSTYSTVLWNTDIVDVSFDCSKYTIIEQQRYDELHLCVDVEDIRATKKTDDYFFLYLNCDDKFPMKTKYKISDIEKLENDKDGILIIFKPLSDTYIFFQNLHINTWKNGETQTIDYSFLVAYNHRQQRIRSI